MSKGINLCVFLGHLGRDPEIRFSQSGVGVCNFSLAVSGREKREGEWVDKTEWVNVVVLGKTAEACEKYLSKGSQAHVVGRMQTRSWDDKDGNKRYTTEIVANDVTFVGGGGQNTETRGGAVDDSDLPF